MELFRHQFDETQPQYRKYCQRPGHYCGGLLGETKKQDVLKDQAMLKRLNDIASFLEKDKRHILYTLDALIKNVKFKQM